MTAAATVTHRCPRRQHRPIGRLQHALNINQTAFVTSSTRKKPYKTPSFRSPEGDITYGLRDVWNGVGCRESAELKEWKTNTWIREIGIPEEKGILEQIKHRKLSKYTATGKEEVTAWFWLKLGVK